MKYIQAMFVEKDIMEHYVENLIQKNYTQIIYYFGYHIRNRNIFKIFTNLFIKLNLFYM